jgi:hypothetical protein
VNVHLWEFPLELEVDCGMDFRTTKEVLNEIIEEVVPINARNETYKSIQAITAYANTTLSKDAAEVSQFLAILSQRFGTRNEAITECSKHQDFRVYLSKRARDLFKLPRDTAST